MYLQWSVVMNDKAQTAALSSAQIATFYSEWLRQTTHRGVKIVIVEATDKLTRQKEYVHVGTAVLARAFV